MEVAQNLKLLRMCWNRFSEFFRSDEIFGSEKILSGRKQTTKQLYQRTHAHTDNIVREVTPLLKDDATKNEKSLEGILESEKRCYPCDPTTVSCLISS